MNNSMKKFILLCAVMCVFSISSNAQIDIMDGPKKKDKPSPQIVQYDSLLNFDNRLDERTYIGQKVFCAKYYCTPLANDHSKYPEEYDLKGKYLTVVSNPYRYSTNHKVLLMDDDSTLFLFGGCGRYCAYEGRNSTFVILGYLEKMKELYEGKDFIYVHEEDNNLYNSSPFNGMFNKETHERNSGIKKGTRWHCDGVGVSMDDKFSVARTKTFSNRVVLYLSNEKYGDYYCYTVSSDMDRSIEFGSDKIKYILNKFMTPEEYAKQQKKNAEAAQAKKEANEKAAAERRQRLTNAYGEEKANMILRGEVAIGFTKSMCREAWGSPRSINTTETARVVHEQWVYGGGRYLYFDNGILTSIQR